MVTAGPARRHPDGLVLALHMGLLRGAAARRRGKVRRLLAENGGHLTTGFAGTTVVPTLTENGLTELPMICCSTGVSGWLYESIGATSIWER